MTLVEYVASLQDQNVPESEWFDKVQQWKKENNYEDPNKVKKQTEVSQQVNVTEEGKTPVVTEESTTVATATPNVQAALSGIGEFGTGPSVLPFTNPYNQQLSDVGRNISDDLFRGGLSLEDYENKKSEYEKQKKLYNEAVEDFEFKKQEQEKGFQAIESGEIKYDTRVLIQPPKGTRFKEGSSKEFTFNQIQQMIDSNQPGFENFSTVADYVKSNPNAEIINYTSMPMEGTVTVLDEVSLDPYNISDIEETLGNNVWNLTGNDLISNEIVVKDNISGIDEDYFFTLGSEKEAEKEKNDGSTAINIEKVEKYRTERLGKQASLDFSNITFDNILDSGKNLLTKKEIEFINLPKEKQDEIAKDENYGEALFFGDNLINIDLEDVPEAQLELFEKSNKMATTTEVGVLKNKLKQEYFKLVGLAQEIYNYDVKNEKPSMRISGYLNDPKFLSKYADSKYFVGFNDEQKNLIKEIATTGKLPKNLGLDDFKDGIVMPGVMNFEDQESGHPLIKEFNNTLKDYRIINRALLLNRDPLTTEQDDFWSSAAKRTSEILGLNVDTEFEKQSEYLTWIKANGFVPSEIAMKNDLFVRLPNGSFNIEEKFASEAGAGAIDLTKWIGETYLFTRLTGNFVARSQKALNLAWKNSKNLQKIPYAVSAFTAATNVLAQSTTFTGGTLVSQYLDGEFDIEELRSSAGFGASLATGHLAYDPFVNYLRKSKFGKIFSPVVDRLTRYAPNTYKRVSRSVGSGFTGATTYQIGGVINQGGIRDADGNITISLKTQSLEFIKMVAAGVFTKAIPNFQTIKKEFKSDIISVKNRGKLDLEAKKSANYLGVNEKSVTDVDENSLDNLNKAFNEKVDNLIARKRKGEITKEEADAEFKILKENYRVVDTQIAVNSAYKMIKAEESSGNAPKESEFYIVSGKIKNGEKLNERDGEVLAYYGLDGVGMLYKRLGIQKNSANDRYLQSLIMNESLIDAQLNGKSFILTPYGLQPINPTEFVTPKDTPARANAREFLRKRLELDTQIYRLKKLDTKNLSESELLKHKNSIKKKQEELEQYVEGGKLYDNIQSEIQGAAITAYEKDIKQADPSKGAVVEARTPEEFQKIYDESGFKAEDVKGRIAFTDKDGNKIINKEFALEQRNFTPVTHEIPHSILKDSFKDAQGNVTPEGIKMIDGVLENLTPRQKRVLDEELLSRYEVGESKEKWYEENITVLAELIKRGEIQFNKSFGEGLAGLVPAFKNFLPNIEVNPNTGKGIFDMLKAQDLGRVTIEKSEAEGKPAPKGELAPAFSLAKKDSDTVNKLFEEKGKDASFEILELLRPTAVALAKRFKNRPNYDEQLLVDEIMTGKRGMLDVINDYAAKVEKKEKVGDLSLFLNNSFSTKTGFKRYIEIADRNLGKEFDQNVDDLAGLKEAPAAETAKEAPVEKTAKKPTETVEFSQAQVEKIGAKDKAEVETRITEATNEAFKGQDVKTFGQTRNVPKSVADIYAGMFGLNPQTITDKTRNYQKTDTEGLTTAKQFLLKNANNDFARLPKTKDGFGKGTFLPRNVMNALYADGKLTGTLKDYMDLIRQKPTKPIYRDAVGQTIRGLLNLHIRNRMFEDLVTTTPERLRGGAKFSQAKIAGKQKSGQERLDSKVDPKALEEARNNKVRKREILVNDFGSVMPNEIFRGVNFTMGNRIDGSFRKRGFDMITDPKRISNLDERKRALDLIEQNEILDLTSIKQDAKANEPSFTDAQKAQFKESLTSKAGKDYKLRLKNKDLHDKGVDLQLDKELEIARKSPESFAVLRDYIYNPNLNANSNRAQATNVGIEYGAVFTENGKTRRREEVTDEHVFNAIEHANAKLQIYKNIIDAEKSGDKQKIADAKNSFERYKKWIKDNYIQVALKNESDVVKGNLVDAEGNSWIDSGGTSHPVLMKALNKAIKSGKDADWDKVPSSMLRYFNGYKNKNGESASLNPNNLDVFGKNVAKDFNVEVNKDLRQNPNVVKKQGDLINKVILTEAGILEGSKAVSREKAKQLLDNYLKTAKQETRQAEINNNLQPNVLKMQGVKSQDVEAVVSELNNLDKALNTGRVANFSAPKKIRVFDFDDTLARSKSKVLYTVPNAEGGFSEGATKLKAIFMVGGPGAGKTNVGKGLQLGRRGYKVVNQDIALEAMKSEAGLPAKESDYTAEQRSTRSKLGAAARKAAVAKFDKYAAAGDGMVIDGTGASYNATTKKIKALEDAGYEVHMVVATTPLETAIGRNKARAERSLPDFVVEKTYESVQESLKKYREDFGDRLYEINTETIEYGKPLPNDFLQQVYDGINANKVGKVDATSFAENYDVLESQGAEFDFREFSKVIEGKKGPLFSVAQKIAAARGTEDIFILTARPADAAKPIQEFMKANGIDIPLQNITGLGDGTAAAKGRWIAGKAAEGYNDFYFADDAVKNVQAVKEVLSQVDVKSKVQQARFSKAKDFDKIFNNIIEAKTGIESYKQFSAAKAKTIGANKGKFGFFIPASAEDFTGLLYRTLGKGKVGDAQMAFYKENLLDPYNKAEMAISQAKVAAGRDYKELKKQFKNIPKTLEKETGISKFKYQHAIRTYIWDKQGLEVPGLSKRDQKRLVDFVSNDAELSVFADNLITIQKGRPYPEPNKDWTAGTITTDVIGGINKINRAEYLKEWQENVDIIFSEKNMNKLEAAFGPRYVEALKNSLAAMKSGSNRPLGGDRISNRILDWVNNSIGAVMFLNTRSAVLQTISSVNFINWGDNNLYAAGKAFGNQKQYWKDFLTLMNSDYLLERRDGLKINVSESEIADAVENSKNKATAAISYLLNKGFVFTRYADSFAIASGGATFYRNRIKSLMKEGMSQELAEQQAFEDFRLIAEENQQSSSPMRISQQQRSTIGRMVLAFGNTQMQYARIQKRAIQDLVNGRGDWKSNISKIVYYGAIQNLMFNGLQSALGWSLFDDDEDEKAKGKRREQKLQRTLNGMIDSQLKGLGIAGAVTAGVKNALMTIAEEAGKKSPKFEEAIDDLINVMPAIGSKVRKIKSAARTMSWNRKEIKEKGFSLDNPAYLAGAQVISGFTNIPVDEAAMKINTMRNILNPYTEAWQKVALGLGWSTWDVDLPYWGLAEEKPVLTETEKQTKKLFDLNKSNQVKMLLDLGLTKKQIRALTKEEQRVQEIIKLQNKKKNGKDKS